ncbi:MAG: glycerol-3-phosphate cytidyltransferase [Clostridiales bacterium]|nr:glycerol-3-phosphate cytidyltransferase [Clostridiales bacterium]
MKKVITYGTFDLFHDGHYNILKRAREYGDYLIVGVTGENYDIGRGKLSVHDSLAERIENVKKTGLADEIIVEEYLGQKIGDIIKYDIDTFVIGDDWKGKFDHLSRYCNMVYLERTKGISSTQIRSEILTTYSIGIITDIVDDNQLVKEAGTLNSFRVTSVYSDDVETAEEFQKKYEGVSAVANLDEFFAGTDIVYIRCATEKRAAFIRKAITQKKHVICDPPFSFSLEEQKKLYQLAKENNVILMDNVKMVYIHVFNQLLWMTQGGLIGDILSFQCSISRNDRDRKNIFYDLLALGLCPMIKIMGGEYDNVDIQISKDSEGIEFASLDFKYESGRVLINVGNKVRVRNQLEIIGSSGSIKIDGNWWRGSYFELDDPEADEVEIYNTNYHGNGFKYLLKAMADMLANGRIDTMGLFQDESLKIIEIVEKVKEKETTES